MKMTTDSKSEESGEDGFQAFVEGLCESMLLNGLSEEDIAKIFEDAHSINKLKLNIKNAEIRHAQN